MLSRFRLVFSILTALMLGMSLNGQWRWTQAMVLGMDTQALFEAADTTAFPSEDDESVSTLAPVTPDFLAHGYVRSLYAGDDALGRELYPQHSGGRYSTERAVKLQDSYVLQLTPGEAGVADPLPGQLYFHVTTWVTRGPLHGQGDYLVMLQPQPDAPGVLKVGEISGSITWLE